MKLAHARSASWIHSSSSPPGLCPSRSRTSLCLSRDVWVPLFGLVEFIIADIPGDVVETALGKSIWFPPTRRQQMYAVGLSGFS